MKANYRFSDEPADKKKSIIECSHKGICRAIHSLFFSLVVYLFVLMGTECCMAYLHPNVSHLTLMHKSCPSPVKFKSNKSFYTKTYTKTITIMH
uniref:Uncharacterized protein n=1 Tax=Rhizophora mucronata TaxID=61149 RepID=A0A2P2K1S7_RHIMU